MELLNPMIQSGLECPRICRSSVLYLCTPSSPFWSKVSTGHKWDAFPAGALAWRISDEAFMEKTRSWLDNLKLRVSYGITGNSGGTTAYSTTTQAYVYAASGISINGKIVPFTQYSGTYGSSDLGWEKASHLCPVENCETPSQRVEKLNRYLPLYE